MCFVTTGNTYIYDEIIMCLHMCFFTTGNTYIYDDVTEQERWNREQQEKNCHIYNCLREAAKK